MPTAIQPTPSSPRPSAQAAAAPATPAPPTPATPATPAPDPAVEIAQLKARLAELEPAPENAPASEPGPVVERVNMGGLVLQKTVNTNGKCETKVLKRPMIDRELIRATRAVQRDSGF